MIMLDVENAFHDTVRYRVVIYKLQRFRLPLYPIRMIDHYLRNCTIVICCIDMNLSQFYLHTTITNMLKVQTR